MVLPGQYVGQTLRLDQPDSVGGEIIAISDISLGTQEKTVPPRTARLDLHCLGVDLPDFLGLWDQSTLFACCWRHCHFLLEFLSRCRAVFLTDDRELVPDGKVKACRPELLTR